MARLTDRQRLERVLGLLAGVRHPEVRARLVKQGFRDADEDEGWRHLRTAAEAFHAGASPGQAVDNTLPQIDAWENRWFPAARAALRHRYPAIEKRVFHKLGQQQGLQVVLSVSTFVQRIRALASSTDDAERAAAKFLAQRGLDSRALDQVKALLDAAMTIPTRGATSKPPPPPADRAAALDQLWAWYLDWSGTARAVIPEARLRRVLGFGRGG